MKKYIYIKKIIKKIIKMDLLEDLRISLLNFSLVMIYIIHKMLVLLKNTSIFLKMIFLNAFLKSLRSFYSFLSIFFFNI